MPNKQPKQQQKKKKAGKQKKKSTLNGVDKNFASIKLSSSVASRGTSNPVRSKSLMLPKCTLQYALAISDPFHPSARGACVPVGSAPTMKTHAFARFDVALGTTGIALVYMVPSLSSSIPSIYITNGTWAGATNQPFATSATLGSAGVASTLNAGWVGINHNGPYNSGVLLNALINNIGTLSSVQGRMVSAGIRSQYTGTTLNESGLMYCYHDSAHQSVSGATASALGGYGDLNIEGVSRKPCTLVAHAVDEDEQGFSTNNDTTVSFANILYPYSQGSSRWAATIGGSSVVTAGVLDASVQAGWIVPVGSPIACMLLTGVAGQTFHLESIFHMEYAGFVAAPMLTPVMADVQGAAMCRTAALALPAAKLDNPNTDVWTLMYKGLEAMAVAAKPYVVPAIRTAISAILA